MQLPIPDGSSDTRARTVLLRRFPLRRLLLWRYILAAAHRGIRERHAVVFANFGYPRTLARLRAQAL